MRSLPLPPDITISVRGFDRYWVADALRREANDLRDQYRGRRAKTTMGRNANARADRLWNLALEVEP